MANQRARLLPSEYYKVIKGSGRKEEREKRGDASPSTLSGQIVEPAFFERERPPFPVPSQTDSSLLWSDYHYDDDDNGWLVGCVVQPELQIVNVKAFCEA